MLLVDAPLSVLTLEVPAEETPPILKQRRDAVYALVPSECNGNIITKQMTSPVTIVQSMTTMSESLSEVASRRATEGKSAACRP